jgi:hypothetical protein
MPNGSDADRDLGVQSLLIPGTKRINRRATMRRYVARMAQNPPAWFAELDGSYLSCYSICITVPYGADVSEFIKKKCAAWHLMNYCQSIGVNVLGITSEKREHNEFICHVRRRTDRLKIVYVDKHAYFGHKTASKYRELQSDIVHYKDNEPTSLNTFFEYL